MSSIQTRWEKLPVLEAEMPVYVAIPSVPEVRAGVIVLQEIFGVNSHIREVTERFAREGYLAVAPDVFHRSGERFEAGYDNYNPGRARKAKTSDADFLSDVDFLLKWLQRQGVTRVGTVGFCYGGRQSFLTACAKSVDSAVGFYGGGTAEGPLKLASWIACPIQLHFGEKDSIIPLDEVRKIESELKAAGKDAEIHIYGDSPHGFFCDQRKDYRPDPAREAWKRTLTFFRETLRR